MGYQSVAGHRGTARHPACRSISGDRERAGAAASLESLKSQLEFAQQLVRLAGRRCVTRLR
jgi:hypothetical protein